MFSIAICDDDSVFCDQLKCMVGAHLKELGVEYQILVYNSIRNIGYDVMEGMVFDALFLDIEFPNEKKKNGVYLGKYLREMMKNDYSQIVYVSSKEQYAMQLFQIRPMDFLLKPLDVNKLKAAVDKMLYLQNISKKTFTYSFGAREHRLELGKILYFESAGRKVKIVCNNGNTYYYNGRISDVYEKLKSSEFFSPHKSFVVNYHAVEQWSRKALVVVNGDNIPVSRNKVEEIRELQLNYEKNE